MVWRVLPQKLGTGVLLLAFGHANAVPMVRQEARSTVVDSSGVLVLDGEQSAANKVCSDDLLLEQGLSEDLAMAGSEQSSNADKNSFTFTFADAIINVDDPSPAEGQPLSAYNKITKLQRNITVDSHESAKMGPLTLPGRMRSANLFLFDVMLLPHQNMLAIFSLGPKPSAYVNSGSTAEKELNKLTVRLAFYSRQHELNCGIIDPRATDTHGVGSSIIMLCKAINVNFSEALKQAQHKKCSLAIQLGQELVHVSPETLSAGQSGFTISRAFTGLPSSLSSGRLLSTSVVMPWFGGVPPYLAETMTYLRKVGVSHVYMGLYNLKVPGEMKNALQKAAQPGFVSILELDAWNVFNWSVPYKYEIYQALVNDWALYHAKSWDDLLLTHDYDELVVPRQAQNLNLALGNVLSAHGLNTAAIDDLCYLALCPLITYGPYAESMSRTNRSRAEDFPFMDGGKPTVKPHKIEIPQDHCYAGGYLNVYSKPAIVVRNIYKALIHTPAACSSVSYKEQVAGKFRAIGKMLVIKHEDDVVLQHWTGMFQLNRFTPIRHLVNASIFANVWGPHLR